MRYPFLPTIAVALAGACAPTPRCPLRPAAVSSSALSPASRSLHALFEAEWDDRMHEDPAYASRLGDRRYNDRWEDVSLAAIRARKAHAVKLSRIIAGFDRRSLSPEDQLDYDLFKRENDDRIELDR